MTEQRGRPKVKPEYIFETQNDDEWTVTYFFVAPKMNTVYFQGTASCPDYMKTDELGRVFFWPILQEL